MPRGDNIWNQTIRAKRRRNPGSLEGLRRQLWSWLSIIDDGLQALMVPAIREPTPHTRTDDVVIPISLFSS